MAWEPLLIFAFLLSAHAQIKKPQLYTGYSVGSVRQRLQPIPAPMTGMSLDAAILGHWFVQYRKAPASWYGSEDFTDYEDFFTRNGKSFVGTFTWRKGLCTTTSARFDIIGPGTMMIRDAVGDVLSGQARIVSGDKSNFVIWWVCTKKSVTGAKCIDPLLTVATRARYPSPKLLTRIDGEVRRLFGITLAELPKMFHGMSCGLPKKG